MPLDQRLRLALCVGAVSTLCGCPNPNTYGVPRTLNPGDVQVTAAPEFFYASVKTNGASSSIALPTVPSVGVRIGITQNFDLGVRAQNLDSLGVDGKFLILKGPLDFAVNPGVQSFFITSDSGSVGFVYFHLPLMLGINLSQRVTLVPTAGIVYVLATSTLNTTNSAEQSATATGFLARFGLGVDIRISPRFAVHPEVTLMKGFDSSDLLYVFGGIGFNFGKMPDYSDLGGAPGKVE